METPSSRISRKWTGLVVFVLLAIVATACGEGGGATGDSLDGSRWELTSVRDGGGLVGAHPATIATVEFADGRASGSTGCNRYQFPYSTDVNSISFGESTQTGSACHTDYLDQSEAFIKAIQASTEVSRTADGLELTDGAGIVQMALRPATELPLAGVAWKLAWYGSGTASLAGAEIGLTFATDGSLEGFAGCNHYSASYKLKGGQLAIGSIAHTEKACLDPGGVMAQEADYLNVVASFAAFSTSLTGLGLFDADDDLVAEYRFGGRIR